MRLVLYHRKLNWSNTFGKPDANTFESVLSAAQFLSYGNTLKVVRAVGTSARNATASGTGILTQNKTVFDGQSPAAGDWAQARYPGVTGNASRSFSSYSRSNRYSMAEVMSKVLPGTSAGAAAVGGSNDEIHLWVYDVDGTITGTLVLFLNIGLTLSQASVKVI